MKLKIFACPECMNRRFTSLNGLNNHLTKSHPSLEFRIIVKNGLAYRKIKKRHAKTMPVKVPHGRAVPLH
jgi:hypothetical protein